MSPCPLALDANPSLGDNSRETSKMEQRPLLPVTENVAICWIDM